MALQKIDNMPCHGDPSHLSARLIYHTAPQQSVVEHKCQLWTIESRRIASRRPTECLTEYVVPAVRRDCKGLNVILHIRIGTIGSAREEVPRYRHVKEQIRINERSIRHYVTRGPG
jgi:hypothetical protein